MDIKKFDYLNFSQSKNTNYNNNNDINKPRLVEHNVKYFLKNVLKNCHTIKQNNYNLYFNSCLLIFFIILFSLILSFKYKGYSTNQELLLKQQKDKEYIMSKLFYYNRVNYDNKQKMRNNMITNLPDFNEHPEASILHNKMFNMKD
jgi:hypothetical protein|tara:strand:+ start:2824 stop:3261 length:438 start_codon:yes stop_codon:yes gene_type:complete